MPTALSSRQYICPGERHPIPSHVHAARIAIGYSACRTCPFSVLAPSPTLRRNGQQEEEARNLSPHDQTTEVQSQKLVPLSLRRGAGGEELSDGLIPSQTTPTIAGRSRFQNLLTPEGIRGVYQNELDSVTAERFATGLATLLWEQVQAESSRVPPKPFPVVVGYDERPWSIPIAVAVGSALRRAGCETIDIGLATGPQFRFVIAHLEAVAGVLVTGSGCGPAFTGLEFVLSAGKPASAAATLDRLANIAASQNSPLTRRGGGLRVFDAAAPYEASLWRHFPDRAPITIVAGSSSALLRKRLELIQRKTGFNLRIVKASQRFTESAKSTIATAIRESKSSFGFWIDEDGTTCKAFDETGALVPDVCLTTLLLSQSLEERPTGTVVVDWSLGDKLASSVLRKREVVRSRGTAEAMFETMRDHAAIAGADSAGRFWLPGLPPSTDALITLARLIQVCSNDDRPLSQRIKKAAS